MFLCLTHTPIGIKVNLEKGYSDTKKIEGRNYEWAFKSLRLCAFGIFEVYDV